MKIPSGTEVFDKLLEGGYDKEITTIYGPASTGKTTACLLAVVSATKRGKVFFMDTEKGFSLERLKRLTKDYKKSLDNIFLARVNSFEEQNKKIGFIFELIKRTKIELLIVDTIGAHYRNVLQSDVKNINSQMANQLKILTEISRNHAPVILTNQVYNMPGKKEVCIVGGDMVRNYSRCLVELKKFKASNRGAVVRKPENLKNREIAFKIVEGGFIPL